MAVTVSSFSTTANGFSQEQIDLFKDADVIFCETKPQMESVMDQLGVSLDGKKIFSIYETYESEPDETPIWGRVKYVLETYDKKSIVIISDDGLPNIVDPYSKLISKLVAAGIHINITPNVSSLTSAIILADIENDQFCFGGILVIWEDYIKKMKALKDISDKMPLILFMVIPDYIPGEMMMGELSNIFGPEREAMIMHSIGTPKARTYKTQVKNLWARHEPHLPEPFTLVIYPPAT